MIRKLAALAVICFALVTISNPGFAEGEAANAPGEQDMTDTLLEHVADNDHRLPYQVDNFIALGCLALAFLTAFLLNHARPQRRVVGTFLAAAMALGIAAIIGWLYVLGSLDNMRPAFLPTDNLKPLFMRGLGLDFLAAGLFLLLVTYWQSKRDDVLELNSKNEETRYGRRTRVLHWTTAILFLALIPMGIYTSMIPEDVWYRQGFYVVHKSLGLTVLLLVVIRLIWHQVSPTPALDPELKTWERRSAHTAHILLYGFMIAFPITGFIMSTYGGKYSHFFFWDTPLFWGPDMDAVIPYAVLHKLALPVFFYVVIAAHVAGALKHRFIDRHEDALRRMVS